MTQFAPYLAWLDSQGPRLADCVRRWASINSGTWNLPGLAQMVSQLERDFAVLGQPTQQLCLPPIQAIDARGRIVEQPVGPALRIVRTIPDTMRILLCIHTDTVYNSDHPFQQVTQREPGIIQGPGVTDAKGGIAVMLGALEAFERSPWAGRLSWEVLLNPDEEVGSHGSHQLLIEAAARNHVGLLFESATPEGSMAAARKGSGNFTAVVHGRAAHAGREPAAGRNAIEALAALVSRLAAISDPAAGIHVNCARVEGGGALNVVPDLAICRFNVRVVDPATQARAQHAIDQAIADVQQQREGIRIELHGQFTAPPKLVDPVTRELMYAVEHCGRELGQAVRWHDSGGVSDGNRLAAAGLPNLDALGVRGGAIHSDQEFMITASLVERAQLTALLLMKMAAGIVRLPSNREVA